MKKCLICHHSFPVVAMQRSALDGKWFCRSDKACLARVVRDSRPADSGACEKCQGKNAPHHGVDSRLPRGCRCFCVQVIKDLRSLR